MKGRIGVLVALVVAVTLASVAAAGPDATKQRVAINMKIFRDETFVLTPLQAGTLKSDSGGISNVEQVMSLTGRTVTRDGQNVTIYSAIWTLKGKRGVLTIRERTEWVDVGSDVNGDAKPDSVALGTWNVVRGTGQYAGIVGKGRFGHIGLGSPWYARYEGLLTAK